jgi:hypothetical protein
MAFAAPVPRRPADIGAALSRSRSRPALRGRPTRSLLRTAHTAQLRDSDRQEQDRKADRHIVRDKIKHLMATLKTQGPFFANSLTTLAVLPVLVKASAAFAEGGAEQAVATMCEEPYGFLPCSLSTVGNLFLMSAFGFLLFFAAGLISEGSELLLEVLDPGVVGGLLLPVLGAFADCMIVLVSAVGGTVEQAQEEVAVGLGVLAGSTVMLLTIAWAGSLWAGRCDLTGPGGTAVNRKLTEANKNSLTETGVTTDNETKNGAIIMGISCLPYLFVQIPLIDGHPAEGPEAALAGAVCCLVGFVGYSAYQIYFPVLQKKKMEDARYKVVLLD